jgi:hypothetical protein
VDPRYARLIKPWNEKDFLKGITSNKNRFCREFMGGNADKCQKFYKRFVNTSMFHTWLIK